MAERPSNPTALFSCVKCGENVKELRCLPCLHSVSICDPKCQATVDNCEVYCEVCKETFSVPSDGFPTHPFALRKALKGRYQKEEMHCHEDHETLTSAVAFCTQCSVLLCSECLDVHRNLKLLKTHITVPLSAMEEEDKSLEGNWLTCKEHKEKLRFYCHQCRKMICVVCHSAGSCRQHNAGYLNEQLSKLNMCTVIQCITSAEREEQRITASLQHTQVCKISFQEQCGNAVGKIERAKDLLVGLISARCEGLVAEVKAVEEEGIKELNMHETQLRSNLEKLKDFCSLSNEITRLATPEEQLWFAELIVNRTATLLQSTSCHVKYPRVTVHPNMVKEASLVLPKVCGISREAYLEKCSLDFGPASYEGEVCYRPWANTPLSFRVITKDMKGNPCTGGEKVLAVLHPVTAGVPVFGEVTDKEDGTYEVQFKYAPSEKCNLSVTVKGNKIQGDLVKVHVVDFKSTSSVKQEITDDQMRKYFRAIAVDAEGNLLTSSDRSKSVRIFNKEGVFIRSLAVDGVGDRLDGLALTPLGHVVLTDSSKDCVKIVTLEGTLICTFGSTGQKEGQLGNPCGVAVNAKGTIFIVEWSNHRVSMFSSDGIFLHSFGSKGSQNGQFLYPCHVCIGPDSLLYITDKRNNRVQVFTQNGDYVSRFGDRVLSLPTGIAVTKDGFIIVASYDSFKVSIFSPGGGACVWEVKNVGLDAPSAVAVDDNGFICVTDSGKPKIIRL